MLLTCLGYHLFSIPSCIGDGHTFFFDTKGVTVHLKSGQELLVPPVGKIYFGYGHRLVSETEQACAVIVPGLLPTTDVDINAYHRSAAHTPSFTEGNGKTARCHVEAWGQASTVLWVFLGEGHQRLSSEDHSEEIR